MTFKVRLGSPDPINHVVSIAYACIVILLHNSLPPSKEHTRTRVLSFVFQIKVGVACHLILRKSVLDMTLAETSYLITICLSG